MSDSLWPHESEHARLPCPSPTPGVHWVVIRKVQIKTRKRYYFISIRMTTTKKISSKCWWRCGEIRTFPRCWQECRLVPLLWENCLAVLKKNENIELPYDTAIPLLGLYPREMITFIHTKMWTRMFKATIFIMSQNWDLSIDKWISKMWYIHTMRYSLFMKWNSDTCANMDKSWKYDAKWKKPETKKSSIGGFHLSAISITGNSIQTKSTLLVSWAWAGSRHGRKRSDC